MFVFYRGPCYHDGMRKSSGETTASVLLSLASKRAGCSSAHVCGTDCALLPRAADMAPGPATANPAASDPFEALPTTELRGEALLEAKKKRLERETRLGQVKHRVGLLADEAERIRKEIEEAKTRTRERKELAERSEAIKKIDGQTKTWISSELEERRQAVAHQRRVAKQAIEAKRLALLEARHADFIRKKQEAAQMRLTIINARAAKQQQKQKQMAFVREQSVVAKQRMRVIEAERQKTRDSHMAVDQAEDDALARDALLQIQRLAAEEQRLLGAVMKTHAQHRNEFDNLRKAKASYVRGLTATPTPLGLTAPLAPHSVLLDRRPASASGVLQSQRPPSTPSSSRGARRDGSGDYGNSGGAARGAYGNSAPSSPRTGLSPRPPSASSVRSSRPGSARSARAVNATPVAPGGLLTFASPGAFRATSPGSPRGSRTAF